MIFSPEHGLRSLADERVNDSQDSKTNLPVYSLYGRRKAPTPAMFDQIDLVMVDLQDLGLRVYTYPAAVANLMKAAKLAHKPVYILDRPNPLGLKIVDGALLEESRVFHGLTTIASIPFRTGMTLGESALYLNHELKIGAEVHVIPVKNYSRQTTWEQTKLNWVPSSPALQSIDQARLYAAFEAFEPTNVSVGRSLDNRRAFHRYGAPYFTQDQVELLIRTTPIPGLKLSPISWTPDNSKFKGIPCVGFEISITDLELLNSFESLVDLSKSMHAIFKRMDFQATHESYGSTWLFQGIMNLENTASLVSRMEQDLIPFRAKQKAYRALVYPEVL